MIFRKGYKYQLQTTELFTTKIYPPEDITAGFVDLNTAGLLQINKGFAWDGPTGPVLATDNFMRGSLAHDALYGLMQNGYLCKSWRKASDQLLIEICRKDGMSVFRCWYVYHGVRLVGGFFLTPEIDYEV